MKTKIRKNRTGIIGIAAVIACAIVFVSAPAFAEIVLEIHSNTTDGSTTFTDSSNPVRVISTIDGAKHSTAIQAKFGGSSMHFDGAGDYLDIADSDEWDFGTGDFTIDCWFNKAALGVTNWIFGQGNASQSDDSFRLSLTSANKLEFFLKDSGDTRHYISSTNTFSATAWHHFAAVRDNDDLKIFLDGTLESTVDITDITAKNSASKLAIGRWGENEQAYYAGYLDDFYIRKGEALDTNQLASIVSIGGEAFEHVRGGINTTLGLGYSTAEIDQLAQLYADGAGSVTIGDLTWSYLDGELPGDPGGLKAIGESYMYDGKWYVKLGSGLEGVPEVPKGPALLMAMVFVVCAVIRKRLVSDGGHRFTGLDV